MATSACTNDGEWLYDVGLPAKSGIGGARHGVPARAGRPFSPRLDVAGNSVRGVRAAARLAAELGLGLFGVPSGLSPMDAATARPHASSACPSPSLRLVEGPCLSAGDRIGGSARKGASNRGGSVRAVREELRARRPTQCAWRRLSQWRITTPLPKRTLPPREVGEGIQSGHHDGE